MNQSISRRNIPLLYLEAFFAGLMLIMPIRILWMQKLVTNGQIALLTSILFLTVVLTELPTGALADLVGKKWTIISGHLVNIISLIMYVFASSIWGFGIAMVLQGIGESLRSGANTALLYDTLVEANQEANFRRINSHIMTTVQVAFVVANFLGGFLGTINLTWPFIGYGFSLLTAVFLLTYIKEPRVDSEKFTLKNYKTQTIVGSKHLFRNPRITQIALLYILVGGIGWTFQRLLRDMILIEVGYKELSLGLIGGALRLLNIIVLAKIAQSVKAIAKGWDVLFLPILMVLTYGSAFWLNQMTGIAIVAGIMMIGTGRFLLLTPYLQANVESKYRATAVSTANMLVSVLLVIGSLLIGILFKFLSLAQIMLIFSLISLIIIIPLSIAVKSQVKINNK